MNFMVMDFNSSIPKYFDYSVKSNPEKIIELIKVRRQIKLKPKKSGEIPNP